MRHKTFKEWKAELPLGKAKVMHSVDVVIDAATVFADHPEVEVILDFHTLVVEPSMRRRGIGKRLVKKSIEVRKYDSVNRNAFMDSILEHLLMPSYPFGNF